MKTLPWILLPLAYCAAAITPEIDGLIVSARALPAEFASDALIRIAALDALEKVRKIELLEQAFQRASGAQQPYKRRAAIARFGGAAGFLNRVKETVGRVWTQKVIDASGKRDWAIVASDSVRAMRTAQQALYQPKPAAAV